MKTRVMLFSALVTVLSLILLGGCATGKYVPKANEELYGTWTNEKTANNDQIQKEVYSADGWNVFGKVSDSIPLDVGTFSIDSKWKDAEGNTWYRILCTAKTGPIAGVDLQELTKLSKSGTVLEYVYKPHSYSSTFSYPSKIDPMSDTYHIYYRAGN